MENNELIIPVYLNQRIVFDLIAMLQGGISTVTRVSSSEENTELDKRRYGSAFGLSQAFSSLLKIDVSGDRLRASEEKAGTQKSEERAHTPSSLFQQLRSTLTAEKKIVTIDSIFVPSSGQIVEFSASLRRNPMIQTMNIFTELVDMAVAFGDENKATNGKNSVKNREKRDPPNNLEKVKNFALFLKETTGPLRPPVTGKALAKRQVAAIKKWAGKNLGQGFSGREHDILLYEM